MADKYILCFDFGMQHIGIAVGQKVTATASPLKVIKAKDGQPNWQEVQNIINEWSPGIIVVGLPLNMDGSEQQMTLNAKKFGRKIQAKFNQKIVFWDERLSTFSARSIGAANKKGRYDAEAAAVILNDYLANN